MYILSACCISPQDTFVHNDAFPPLRRLEGNRWQCIEPDYKAYIVDATLRRRMSRVVKMGVAAALCCVDRAGKQPDAIITATGLGCLTDTEKFLDALLENERQPNPTPFIQSTFNTVGAQVALILGNNGYNNTCVHRGFSMESALLDAMMQIREGTADRVLVGCFDETTDTAFAIMRRLGFRKEGLAGSNRLYDGQSSGTASGEGVAFFMLDNRPVENRPQVKISGIHFFNTPADGTSITDHIRGLKGVTDNIDLLVLGNNGDASGDEVYRSVVSGLFVGTPYCYYKNLCGEYPTSSGFAVYLAFQILTAQRIPEGMIAHGTVPQRINRILIYNHYQKINHSLIHLELC